MQPIITAAGNASPTPASLTVTVSGSNLLIQDVASDKTSSDLMFGLMDDQNPAGIHEVIVSGIGGDASSGFTVPLSALQAAMSTTINGESITATKLIVREGSVGDDTNFGTADDLIDAEGEINYGEVSGSLPFIAVEPPVFSAEVDFVDLAGESFNDDQFEISLDIV